MYAAAAGSYSNLQLEVATMPRPLRAKTAISAKYAKHFWVPTELPSKGGSSGVEASKGTVPIHICPFW